MTRPPRGDAGRELDVPQLRLGRRMSTGTRRPGARAWRPGPTAGDSDRQREQQLAESDLDCRGCFGIVRDGAYGFFFVLSINPAMGGSQFVPFGRSGAGRPQMFW